MSLFPSTSAPVHSPDFRHCRQVHATIGEVVAAFRDEACRRTNFDQDGTSLTGWPLGADRNSPEREIMLTDPTSSYGQAARVGAAQGRVQTGRDSATCDQQADGVLVRARMNEELSK